MCSLCPAGFGADLWGLCLWSTPFQLSWRWFDTIWSHSLVSASWACFVMLPQRAPLLGPPCSCAIVFGLCKTAWSCLILRLLTPGFVDFWFSYNYFPEFAGLYSRRLTWSSLQCVVRLLTWTDPGMWPTGVIEWLDITVLLFDPGFALSSHKGSFGTWRSIRHLVKPVLELPRELWQHSQSLQCHYCGMVRSVVVNADFESFLSLLTSGGSLFSSVFHVVQLRSEETEDIKWLMFDHSYVTFPMSPGFSSFWGTMGMGSSCHFFA